MAYERLLILVAVILVLGSCAGGGSNQSVAGHNSDDLSRLSAGWLKAQPGVSEGNFSFHLLDAAAAPLDDWAGLSIRRSDAAGMTFVLESTGGSRDDIYLYITYPGNNCMFDAAQLNEWSGDEYLLLSVPHRIPDVLVLGLARLGDRRGVPVSRGELVEIRFAAGSERTYRSVSTVNEDPASAVTLEVSEIVPGVEVELSWEERNIGDYNNNSEVEIADITPIGLYFGQLVADATPPEPLIMVDGDENGEINVADLTPIGRNFQRAIEGYKVYHAVGDSPLPQDFLDGELAPAVRRDLYDLLSQEQRRQRLEYHYQATVDEGLNHFYVAAYDGAGAGVSIGPPSNTATYLAAAGNAAPVWDTTVGITGATGTGTGIRLTFGRATDPEGDPITYMLRYTPGFDPMWSPSTVTLPLPDATVSGAPPYEYFVEGLELGQRYNFLLRVQDDQGNSTQNDSVTSATVPNLGTSLDPWPYHRGNAARTGANTAIAIDEPLDESWSVAVPWPDTLAVSEPVVSVEGWVGILLNNGEFRRYDAIDGSDRGLNILGSATPVSRPALDGDHMVIGTDTGIAVFDLGTADPAMIYAGDGRVSAAPLLLGDYIITADEAGVVRAVLLGTGEEQWRFAYDPPVGYSISPAADASSLYVVNDDGMTDKLDLLTGEHLATGFAGSLPLGDSLALDEASGLLYLATETSRVIEISGSDLSLVRNWPRLGEETNPTSPCLVLHSDPPLLMAGYMPVSMIEVPGYIAAYNLEDGSLAWLAEMAPLSHADRIVAGAERLYTGEYILDFQGVFRQRLGAIASLGLGAAGETLYISNQTSLAAYTAAAEDLAPNWPGAAGITGLTNGDGEITVQWDYAVDDHSAPVYYAIFVSEGGPPDFDPPYSGTTVITDIPPSDGNWWQITMPRFYTVNGLDNGRRYYVGVRAYDKPWDENPNIDTNTNWLATTPPWQREELLLGTDLSDGDIFQMRGILDPALDGIHLVYTDEADGHLNHIWGDTGSWLDEGPNLAMVKAASFDLAWQTDLVIAWADNSLTNMLYRTGDDAWSNLQFFGTSTTTNPQISADVNIESAMAYTQHINGTTPPVLEEHYYITRTFTGPWQPPISLDDQNYSGRDLDLLLNPADVSDPWTAFQRGQGYAPNRITPLAGQCMYARRNGAIYDIEEVDPGANYPDSDCGKRVRQVIDAAGNPHLAYLDLNASSTDPVCHFKYAYHDGTDWTVELVDETNLSFQTGGLQFTYGELSLVLLPDGKPAFAVPFRRSISEFHGSPHFVDIDVWVREGPDDWRRERLTDDEYVLPRDREPCVMLITPDDVWHVFFAGVTVDPTPVADRLVHLWRPVS